jgi:hypothetical protein
VSKQTEPARKECLRKTDADYIGYQQGYWWHWHLIVRHVHPDWHGHCDPAQRGYKLCSRPHWHFLWRHRHA